MSETSRLLLIGGSLVCLLVVASTLPAADPRLEVDAEAPEIGTTNSTGTSQTTQTQTQTQTTGSGPGPGSKAENETQTQSEENDSGTEPRIRVFEPVDPLSYAEVQLVGVEDRSGVDIEVDGERVGTTNSEGKLEVAVPVAREMTVTAVAPSQFGDESVSRTVDIRTDAWIRADGARIPGRTIELDATVGSTELSDAAVMVNGTQVTTTDSNGSASIELPETAGPVDVRVERGPLAGEQTIRVAEPRVSFRSPLMFPGSFAVVTVTTSNGVPIEDASVSVNGNHVAKKTSDDGKMVIQLPLADEARITSEVGDETTTATVDGLYLRLTTVVVLIPGFIIGAFWSLGRLLAAIEIETEGSHRQGRNGSLLVALAELLGELVDSLRNLKEVFRGGFGGWSLSWPSFSLPSFDGVRVSFPSPSLSGPGFSRWLSGSSDEPEPDVTPDSGDPIDSDSPSETVQGRRAQIRALWHAFLDRLGVENRERERLTAGQVARRAVSRGFRAASVWQLVAIFRDIEYGNRDPSPKLVGEARALTEDLLTDTTDTTDNTDEEDPQ